MRPNIKDTLKQLEVRHTDLEFKQWLPDEIFAFRCKHVLTQKQLGALLGVSKLHIHYLEHGKRQPSDSVRLCLTLWDFYMRREKRGGDEL